MPINAVNLTGTIFPAGPKGETGPANNLEIGTVEKGIEASATITGDAPNQVLNLVLPTGETAEIEALKAKHAQEISALENLIPTGQASGESIDLNDSAEYKFKKFGISGNSKQETRSGKNKADINNYYYDTISYSDLNISLNNGELTISTDGAKNLTEYIRIPIKINSNGTYTFGIDLKTNKAGDTAQALVYDYTNKKVIGKVFTNTDINYITKTQQITIDDSIDKDNILIFLYCPYDGTVGQAYSFSYKNIFFNEGTNTEYEPYGAMPSPEFPSSIRNCGDNVNLFYLQNENVPNQTWFSIDENQLLKIKQGTGVAPTPIPIDIDLNVGDTVTISAYCVSGKYTTGEISVGLYHNGSDKAWEGQVTLPKGISLKNKTYTTTITVTNTVDTFMPFIYGNPSIEEDIKFYFKVEKGSKASPYSPYNCSNVNITVCNGNLFNIDEIANIDNWVTNKTTSEHPYCYYEFNLKPNTVYTFSRADNSSADNIYASFSNTYGVFDSNHSLIHPSNGSLSLDKVSFTTDKDGIIYLNLYNAKVILDTFIALLKDAQLEEGSVATEYITHQEQTVTFPLTEGQVLHKDDYLADDGIHHKRGQVVFDGTENWTFGNIKENTVNVLLNDFQGYNATGTDSINAMCNYFVGIAQGASLDKECFWFNGSGGFRIRINKDRLADTSTNDKCVESFKSLLAELYANGTPVVVEYDLAEEEIEPYTAEQQEVYDKIKELYSYKGTTHITCEDEVSCIFQAEYYKDLETILNNMQAQILAE